MSEKEDWRIGRFSVSINGTSLFCPPWGAQANEGLMKSCWPFLTAWSILVPVLSGLGLIMTGILVVIILHWKIFESVLGHLRESNLNIPPLMGYRERWHRLGKRQKNLRYYTYLSTAARSLGMIVVQDVVEESRRSGGGGGYQLKVWKEWKQVFIDDRSKEDESENFLR